MHLFFIILFQIKGIFYVRILPYQSIEKSQIKLLSNFQFLQTLFLINWTIETGENAKFCKDNFTI